MLRFTPAYFSLMRTSVSFAASWDILSSVFLYRRPVIAPPLTEVERKSVHAFASTTSRYQQLQAQVEHENSLLNNYELQSIKDAKLFEKKVELEAAGRDLSELEGELEVTNIMREQEWSARADEFKQKFHLDKPYFYQSDNLQSINRKLDRLLVLVVRQRFGQKDYASPWKLPEARHVEGDSLKESAYRCLDEVLQGSTKCVISSNAPFAYHSFKYVFDAFLVKSRYPKPIAKKIQKIGAKIFFFNACCDPKDEVLVNPNEIADHQWLCHEEFAEHIVAKRYKQALKYNFIE